MKEDVEDITKLSLSPLKRTSTQKKLKKERSRIETMDINIKTVEG